MGSRQRTERAFMVYFMYELLGIHNASVSNILFAVEYNDIEKCWSTWCTCNVFSFSTECKWKKWHCSPPPREEGNPHSLGTEDVLMFKLPQRSCRHGARQCLVWVPDRSWRHWKPLCKYLNWVYLKPSYKYLNQVSAPNFDKGKSTV